MVLGAFRFDSRGTAPGISSPATTLGVFILGLEIKRSNEQYLLIIVLKDNNCLRREA